MTSSRQVMLVEGESEWAGLYIDGELAWQSHTLPGWVVLDELNKAKMFTLLKVVVSDKWLEDFGLPQHFDDLSLYTFEYERPEYTP